MGLGERNLEGDLKAAEEGILIPVPIKDAAKDQELLKPTPLKDAACFEEYLKPLTHHPASTTDNHKKGMWQKLWSRKIPLAPVLFIGAILIAVIIILAVLPRRGEMPTIHEKVDIHNKCVDDWILNRGNCYYFSNDTDTWEHSQNFCKSHNSSLADIENEQELDLLNRLKCDSHWIGLSRTQEHSGWVWTNGRTYSESLFQIIKTPVVPGDAERVYLNGDGVKSGSGKYAKKWICKKKP